MGTSKPVVETGSASFTSAVNSLFMIIIFQVKKIFKHRLKLDYFRSFILILIPYETFLMRLKIFWMT